MAIIFNMYDLAADDPEDGAWKPAGAVGLVHPERPT
jgi:hypothetical protein